MTSTVERIRAAAVAVRNLALGGNISTLTLGSTRSMVQYASEALFLRRTLAATAVCRNARSGMRSRAVSTSRSG
jgi:hypothetical protein